MNRNLLRPWRSAFVLGIGAGMFVSIGGAVLLSCDDRYVGAFFFSIALLAICQLGMYLYTGKIGYIVESHTAADIGSVIIGLIGNLVGTVILSLAVRVARPALVEKAANLFAPKLSQTPLQTILAGALCGLLMYTAVAIFKEKNTVAGILFCIPVFILSGFEHSIADMFYFFLGGAISGSGFLFLFLVVIGNTIGGMVFPLLRRLAGSGK